MYSAVHVSIVYSRIHLVSGAEHREERLGLETGLTQKAVQ